MTKRAKAPSGFYSATEAMKRLGMARSSFYDLVEKGKITRIVPPDRSDGYYPKKEIDKMAKAKELFILEYTEEPSTFEKALEEDIRGLYEVCKTLWGNLNTPSYETRLEWYKKNTEMYYVVKQDGIVVGFIGLVPIERDTLQKMMEHPGLNEKTEDILPFIPRVPIHGLFLELGVRSDIPKNRKYGRHLIAGGFSVLETLASREIVIEKLYAHSRTPDGINICRKMGFKETKPVEGDTRIRFELDLRTSSYPLLKEYQRIVESYKKQKNQDNGEEGSLLQT
jgi:predicted DNA-binding transcriptional regulator AlpA